MGDEPTEGAALANFVAKRSFTDFGSFSNPLDSCNTLEGLLAGLLKALPTRYKIGMRKQPQQDKSIIVYNKERKPENGFKSNEISLTGTISGELFVEPSKAKIYLARLHAGFTYPCKRSIVDVLEALDEEFILLTDNNSQPDIKLINLKEGHDEGNSALFQLYGAREITVAIIDGKSMRKRSYVVAAEHP